MIRRILAAVLALLVLVEGTGVARALGGESVECCCGRHDSHRACKCKACPVSKKRAAAETTRMDDHCDGQDDPGVLAVVAVDADFPSLLPLAAVAPVSVVAQPLAGRLIEAGRPPP